MRNSQRPTVEKEVGNRDYTIYKHPAYGVVRVSNPQGVRTLFGSDVEHHDFIQLEIVPATLKRGLNTDWVHGSLSPIVQIAMSHAQFVSMIQSSGKGEGTPCTIQYAPEDMNASSVRLPSIEPLQSKTDLIKDEIQNDTKKALAVALKAIECLESKYDELKAGKAVSKKELSTLEPLIRLAKNKIVNAPSNLKFALTCAEETIDKAVHDAQIEIEASVEHKLRQIGLEAINNPPDQDIKILIENLKSDQSDI